MNIKAQTVLPSNVVVTVCPPATKNKTLSIWRLRRLSEDMATSGCNSIPLDPKGVKEFEGMLNRAAELKAEEKKSDQS